MPDSTKFYFEVGAQIRRIREQRGITQEALGALIGLTRTSVLNIEKGRQKFLAHTLMDISVALHVRPDEILPDVQPTLDKELEQLLEGRPQDEQDWIKNTFDTLKKLEE